MEIHKLDLDDFVEVKRLSEGGMAELFLMDQISAMGVRKKVVIKRIHKQFLTDPIIKELFIQEAQIQSRLDHPNIVQLIDFGKDGNSLYMALEYVEGGDLAALAQILAPLSPQKRAQVGLQGFFEISSALIAIHEQVIHQDISPSNILYSKNGSFKICDFGIAKKRLRTPIGRSGFGQGKIRYMSPEQACGGRIDHRSDIYSLGICFAEFFSGSKLFNDLNDQDLLRLIRKGSYLKYIFALDLPFGFRDLIYRCIQPSAGDRFQSAEDLFFATERIQAQSTLALGSFTLRTALRFSNVESKGLLVVNHPKQIPLKSKKSAKILSLILSLPGWLLLPWILHWRKSRPAQRP